MAATDTTKDKRHAVGRHCGGGGGVSGAGLVVGIDQRLHISPAHLLMAAAAALERWASVRRGGSQREEHTRILGASTLMVRNGQGKAVNPASLSHACWRLYSAW